jgi:hypothetical protein
LRQRAEQTVREPCGRVHHVLAVVQDEQHAPPVQRRDQPVDRVGLGSAGQHRRLAQAERAQHRSRDLVLVRHL